jgi:small redox-active disulfide protein 2
MKEIKILGTGCPKCNQLYNHAEKAVSESGIECNVVKVTDINEITSAGVLMTPALVIDGRVKSSGKLLSVEEIKSYIV